MQSRAFHNFWLKVAAVIVQLLAIGPLWRPAQD